MARRPALFGAFIVLLVLADRDPTELARAREGTRLERRPYRFDPGGAGLAPGPGAIRLTPSDHYTRERGYGWTESRLESYARPELARSRSSWMIDGVAAREVGFRADIPTGVWWLTLWVEAGHEDTSSLEVVFDTKRSSPAWQSFLPPAEPREQLQKIVRLLHARVEVGDGGLAPNGPPPCSSTTTASGAWSSSGDS